MKKLAVLTLATMAIIGNPAYANKPIEVSDFDKMKKDRYGNVLMSNFLNKTVNGLKIDNCLFTMRKDGGMLVDKGDMDYNLCNDKTSKWLAKKVESSKPNFAKDFVVVEYKMSGVDGFADYTYFLVNKKTKQVHTDTGIHFFTKHGKYVPKFTFNVNSKMACTPSSKQTNAYLYVPSHDEIMSNVATSDKRFCLVWNGKRFYSRDYEEYVKEIDGF